MKCKILVYFLICASLLGCSTASDTAVSVLDASGRHPAGWVATGGGNHPAVYLAAPATCKECHGADLTGGISAVSCFSANRSGMTCHAQGPVGHPVGWSAPSAHGVHAKAVASGTDGMKFCSACHGADYRGSGTNQKDCLRCHTTAPHPAKPWFGGAMTHKTTDPTNAPACAVCHTNRLNLSPTGAATLPATAVIGTTGCFNNTLCHGQLGHPADWSAPASHGSAAKAAPGTTQGLNYCTQCHGSNFVNGTGTSCKTCHTSAPHPAAPWRGTTASGTTHTTTDQGNAPVCGRCHAGGARLATPGALVPNATCFNNTLCHGAATAHAFPNPGSAHKSSTTGCSSCHALGSSASPYPPATTHAAPDCKSCHKLSAATAISQMSGCSDCHGDAATGRPNGSSFPNISGRHTSPGDHAVACSTCHAGGGTGSATHGNSNNIVKNSASVILNGTAAGMSIVRNAGTGRATCTGICHGENHNGRTW
jgi:hypothetical protein